MTVDEAIRRTQGKPAGMVNKVSVRYAESVLQPDENTVAAVVANISSHGERFPGIVVLTDQRIMAICGLPGIRRVISLSLPDMEQCKEKSSSICYQARFQEHGKSFSFSVDTDIGNEFSRKLAGYVKHLSSQKLIQTPLDAREATEKLSGQLDAAKAERTVDDSDPLSIAARLAAELAEEADDQV